MSYLILKKNGRNRVMFVQPFIAQNIFDIFLLFQKMIFWILKESQTPIVALHTLVGQLTVYHQNTIHIHSAQIQHILLSLFTMVSSPTTRKFAPSFRSKDTHLKVKLIRKLLPNLSITFISNIPITLSGSWLNKLYNNW